VASLKDKLYFYFAEKNWGVRREYGPYVDAHKEEHRTHRIKHWWLLVRLNWHYRILRRKDYLLDFSSMRKPSMVRSNNSSTSVYLSPHDRSRDRFRFVFQIWNTTGTTNELINVLKLWEQSWWCWKNDNPEVFLIFICCLLEKGEKEEAKRVLIKYIDNIGCRGIWRYMPASQLFVEMGYKDHTIEKSAFVFERLEKNRKENTLEKMLAGKTIAVVGNGPSEIGKKRGEDIDSHDIVIRMNNFQIDGFEEDYGSKTSIWVRNSTKATLDRDNIEEIDYLLWEPDYWHVHILHNFLDFMYRDIRIAGDKVGYFYGLRKEICSSSSVLNPTTGLQMVYYLEKHKNSLKKLDYYGFSFTGISSDCSYKHYFNEPSNAQVDHQPAVEIKYMRQLVGLDKHTSGNSHTNDMYKIYACAFRNYDVKKGNTGGPGGVLAMQRTILGDEFLSCPIEYLFMPEKITYPADVQSEINSIAGRLRSVIQGAYFIQSHPGIKHDLEKSITPVLMCHDIGTAYGAFLLGLKYCVVYHQQGSILNELIASGGKPTEYEIDLMNRIEKRVLEHAVRVYFPSLGAQQVLINTSENVAACPAIPYSEFALYNTIPDVDEAIDYELIHKLGIPNIDKDNTEVFFSCGDFNYDKGMERIPEFLTEYAKHSQKKVVWIGIGSAGAYGIFEQLNNSKNAWPFESYLFGVRTNHSTLLALMEYCDYYIMLHRNSIFDLATLEAMRAGAALILSPTGGNLEFNVENNVVYVEQDNYLSAINEMMSRDYEEWSESNKCAFNTHFSHIRFADNYRTALSDLLNNAGFKAPENKTYEEQNLR